MAERLAARTTIPGRPGSPASWTPSSSRSRYAVPETTPSAAEVGGADAIRPTAAVSKASDANVKRRSMGTVKWAVTAEACLILDARTVKARGRHPIARWFDAVGEPQR